MLRPLHRSHQVLSGLPDEAYVMLETIVVSLLFAYASHNVQWNMNMKYNAYVKHVLRILPLLKSRNTFLHPAHINTTRARSKISVFMLLHVICRCDRIGIIVETWINVAMWSPLLNQVTDILTLSREIAPADAERKSLRYDDYLSFEMQLYFSQKQLPRLVTLSYLRVRGLYFLAVVFAATILCLYAS